MGLTVSVVLATYNGAQFISEQLHSIASQTTPPTELVVCDDASSDSTTELIEKFSEVVNFRVRLYRNEERLGTGKNFEKGVELSKGDIIAFCDQDDVWLPQKLERVRAPFDRDSTIGYVISNARIVDVRLRDLGCSLWESRGFGPELRQAFQEGYEWRALRKVAVSTGMATALRRRVCGEIGALPSRINHDMWYIPMAAAMGIRGALVPESLSLYRQHANQQFGAASKFTILGAWERLSSLQSRLEKNCYYKRCMLQRLTEIGCCSEDLIEDLRREVRHFDKRVILNRRPRMNGFGSIIRELYDGNYQRWGAGLRSSLLDVLRILLA